MIIGGGVVGMNAGFIALGMEAAVYVYDRSIDRLRELDIAFQGRADTCYASTLDIEQRLPEADLVIGAVLVHGMEAPYGAPRPAQADEEERRAGQRVDRPGRLLRDLAGDDSFESDLRGRRRHPAAWRTCRARCRSPPPTLLHLANATLPYVLHLADEGVAAAARQNPGLAKGVNVANGKVTYESVAEATEQPFVPLFEALGEQAPA